MGMREEHLFHSIAVDQSFQDHHLPGQEHDMS